MSTPIYTMSTTTLRIRRDTYEKLKTLSATFSVPMIELVKRIIDYVYRLPRDELVKVLFLSDSEEPQRTPLSPPRTGTVEGREGKREETAGSSLLSELESNPWVQIIRQTHR